MNVKVERTTDNRIRIVADATLNPEQAEGPASELYQHAYQILHEQARDTCTLEGHRWGPARNGRQPDGTQTHIRHCTREHCDHDEALPGRVETARQGA